MFFFVDNLTAGEGLQAAYLIKICKKAYCLFWIPFHQISIVDQYLAAKSLIAWHSFEIDGYDGFERIPSGRPVSSFGIIFVSAQLVNMEDSSLDLQNVKRKITDNASKADLNRWERFLIFTMIESLYKECSSVYAESMLPLQLWLMSIVSGVITNEWQNNYEWMTG